MKGRVLKKLRELTKHEHVKLTSRGNNAILRALYMIKKVNSKPFILIPDQGGWLTYKLYPKLFNFEIKEVKTRDGIIDLKDLEEKAKSCGALLFSSFAGYFAEQPLKQIAEICHANKCLLIEDASGSIGLKGLCDGRYSDIIIGSFGRWKSVNIGYGGFISAKEKRVFNASNVLDSSSRVWDISKELLDKLEKLDSRYKLFFEHCDKIKKDLKEFDIIHRNKRGIIVVVGFNSLKEKEKIISYCEKNKYEYTLCPRYIRVNRAAVSIEVKRL